MKTATKTTPNESGIFPCGNKILVKPDAIEEKTRGGIIIPKNSKDKYQQMVAYGYVVAVGPDYCIHSVQDIEMLVDDELCLVERRTNRYKEEFAQPGDRISFAIHSGRNTIGEDGELYVQMNDSDITALVTKGVTATSLEAREPFGANE